MKREDATLYGGVNMFSQSRNRLLLSSEQKAVAVSLDKTIHAVATMFDQKDGRLHKRSGDQKNKPYYLISNFSPSKSGWEKNVLQLFHILNQARSVEVKGDMQLLPACVGIHLLKKLIPPSCCSCSLCSRSRRARRRKLHFNLTRNHKILCVCETTCTVLHTRLKVHIPLHSSNLSFDCSVLTFLSLSCGGKNESWVTGSDHLQLIKLCPNFSSRDFSYSFKRVNRLCNHKVKYWEALLCLHGVNKTIVLPEIKHCCVFCLFVLVFFYACIE